MISLAIIPARAGSKRIPGKNLEEVGGRSLLGSAIGSTIACTRVVVSTDDARVAEAARRASPAILIHERKPEHATDTAQLEPVIDDVLTRYGDGIDAVVLLQPTSPFRTWRHVEAALGLLESTGCDSVVSVTRLHSLYGAFNGRLEERAGDHGVPRYVTRDRPQRLGYEHDWDGYEEQDLRAPIDEWPDRPPSSWLGALVYENGAIYAFTRKHWDATRLRMGGDMRALVMHWSESVEIDTVEDLEAARRMAR